MAHAIGRLAALVRYRNELLRWGRWAADAGRDADVWHLHDFPALIAIAPRLPIGRPYVYDSHELFFEAGSAARLPRPVRWWFEQSERRLAHRSKAIVTVNASCAAILTRMDPPRVVVVHNCPPIAGDEGQHDRPLRTAAGIGDGVPLVLYHGIFGPARGIEQLIAAMARPELIGAHLALLGFGMLRPTIDTLVARSPAGPRIHVLEAVLPTELGRWVADADVEAIPIQHSTLNHYLSTPNKLFEALAAGVPVVVSDFPAMHAIVLDDPDGPLGETCRPDDPDAIAKALAAILGLSTQDRSVLRQRCARAALERWNWERESSRLVDLYEDLARASR